ncbi:uncharacterized protein LOC144325211 [Podarcis muralis]
MQGKNGRRGGGTPGERKVSRQEEIKDLDFLWLKIKEELKQNENHIENKLEELQERIDRRIEDAIGELSNKVQELTVKTKTFEETNKKIQKDVREQKRETEKVKEGMRELNKTQEQIWDSIAMTEMRQRQMQLKFRGIEEEMNENIRERIIKELAKWLEMKEEEVAYTIDNAYRIKIRTYQNRTKKPLGDCLVVFNSIGMRNLILKTSYHKKLIIGVRPIIVLKEIPVRLLRKREGYRYITGVLRRNNIQFRWEFPEGIAFFFKDKKFKLTNPLEVEKFLRRYERELGKKEDRVKDRRDIGGERAEEGGGTGLRRGEGEGDGGVEEEEGEVEEENTEEEEARN